MRTPIVRPAGRVPAAARWWRVPSSIYAPGVELALLGPFDVVGPRGRVVIGSAKERVLLALLAVRANEVVSAGDVIDGLWGDDPPPSAPKTMQGYVARLRRILDDA